jgi:hypothetical protein
MKPWAPTRLVDVNALDSSGKTVLRLVTSLPANTRYVTLSHCWGLIPITKLTHANFENFLHEIDFNSLTKSFQDAIYITRALDCRYLWIDTLCIIQDSEQD